jgi:hypothetical protein
MLSLELAAASDERKSATDELLESSFPALHGPYIYRDLYSCFLRTLLTGCCALASLVRNNKGHFYSASNLLSVQASIDVGIAFSSMRTVREVSL